MVNKENGEGIPIISVAHELTNQEAIGLSEHKLCHQCNNLILPFYLVFKSAQRWTCKGTLAVHRPCENFTKASLPFPNVPSFSDGS